MQFLGPACFPQNLGFDPSIEFITVLCLIFFTSLMEINSMYLRFSEIPRIFGVFSVGTLVNSEEKKALRLVPLSPGGGSRAD